MEIVCNFFKLLKEWIKKAPIYFLIVVIVSVVGMFASNDFLSKVLILLCVDIGFEYIFANYLIIEKYRAKNKHKEGFNEEYFDVYSEVSRVRLGLFLRTTLFSLMATSYLSTIEWSAFGLLVLEICLKLFNLLKEYSIPSLISIVVAFIVSAIIISKTQNQDLEKLLSKKSNSFASYTKEEKELLEKIKYNSKQSNNKKENTNEKTI